MIRTREDWISAGERAFREVDSFWSRTSDSQAIALARDPQSFTNVFKLPDGSVLAAAVKLTVVAGENLTVGSTIWLPAEGMAPGR